MELINDYKNINNKYSKKIKIFPFTEGESLLIEEKGKKDICEIIIGSNEIEYNSIEKSHLESFIKKKKLSIADDITINEKYIKKFSPSLIQNGLQMINYLSSILYLNEFYKINTIIYNENTKKYYSTSFKDYPPLLCIYKNNSWFQKNDIDHLPMINTMHDINDLKHILVIDIDCMIFKPYLKSLSSYKVKELEQLCINKGIDLFKNNKKKLKKQLYDEINLLHLNL